MELTAACLSPRSGVTAPIADPFVGLKGAPCGLLDSRPCSRDALRHPEYTGSPWAEGRTVARLGTSTPLTGRTNQVELRLTANLQLQPLPQPVT